MIRITSLWDSPMSAKLEEERRYILPSTAHLQEDIGNHADGALSPGPETPRFRTLISP